MGTQENQEKDQLEQPEQPQSPKESPNKDSSNYLIKIGIAAAVHELISLGIFLVLVIIGLFLTWLSCLNYPYDCAGGWIWIYIGVPGSFFIACILSLLLTNRIIWHKKGAANDPAIPGYRTLSVIINIFLSIISSSLFVRIAAMILAAISILSH